MTRSQRLLELLDLLRQSRRPVTAKQLAERLGISVRSVYRDILTLQEQGAQIEGEAGVGYVMQDGFWMPPLMFSEQELEAIVLGMRWASKQTDSEMQSHAVSALAKIRNALPDDLDDKVLHNTLLVPPPQKSKTENVSKDILIPLRQAIREEKIVQFDYKSLDGKASSRTVWPFALGYFESVSVLVGWCETRNANRHFRTDRIGNLTLLEERYPKSKRVLAAEWKKENRISS
ncbi:helix-turn-helix transcriptional regulator [Marinomonas mediterranea]|uniref:helix-turn-helix transcriptional regulator n=1 Tax=Marinomonas mediterranea TaxID=119864 RepID=UPI002349B4D4|nr:YafY family protein [Marinomonas mediterranea]WCN10894.1 HTH domain-containing protein [Marinomonas mediterranea]WCN14955.1 HTH domain-containing protein [Marinomonas mediterranea]